MRLEFINQMKSFEGFRPDVYKCPAGHYTIGYGHVIRNPQDFATGIHSHEAHALLCQDLKKARRAVLRMTRVPLTLHQEEALTSFVFNLGAMAFHRSTLRAKINWGNHQAVPHELRRWVFCGFQKLPGLVRRREWEAGWYQRIEYVTMEDFFPTTATPFQTTPAKAGVQEPQNIIRSTWTPFFNGVVHKKQHSEKENQHAQ